MDWIFDDAGQDDVDPFMDENEPGYLQQARAPNERYAQLPQRAGYNGPNEAAIILQSLAPAERAVLPTSLNSMQETVLPTVLGSDESVILSAPTGAGKTCVLDMAILRSIIVDGNVRIYYVAPSRALCRLQSIGFGNRFRSLQLRVDVVTGDDTNDEDDDYMVNRRRDYLSTKITSLMTGSGGKPCARLIACTPEKLEAETRRCSDEKLAAKGKVLILVDEVHHIGERERGATLELVLTRFLWAFRNTRSNIRFVGVSATIPNVSQIAKWLNGACHFEFTQRPVPLHVHVHGYPRSSSRADYMFEKDLDRHVPEVLRSYGTGKPALVFVSSRKGAKDLALKLREAGFGTRDVATREIRAQDDTLTECLRVGLGFHSAGLSASDRALVENLFRQSKLKVVCCTSTLAVGVDLPANLVVIKSTRAYRGAALGFQDIERATLVQMIGRAGRPGYDTEGTAVIMTSQGEERKFESLSQGLEAVQSRLEGNALREGLNAEIVRGRIATTYDAIEWWSMTFASCSGRPWDQSELEQLGSLGCALVQDEYVAPTAIGRIASSHHLLVSTVAHFSRIISSGEADETIWTLESALRAICDDEEFKDLIPRRDQKKLLNQIAWNLGRFKSPKSARIATGADVAFQLIQARLGGIALSDISLRSNSTFANERAPRLARALLRMLIDARSNRAAMCALLCKCFDAGSWETDEISQLEGIGPKTREKLVQQGILTLQQTILPANSSIVPQRSAAHARQILNSRRQLHAALSDGALIITLTNCSSNDPVKPAKTSRTQSSDWWIACLSEPNGQVLGWTETVDRLAVSISGHSAFRVLGIHRKALGIDTMLQVTLASGKICEIVAHDATFWNGFSVAVESQKTPVKRAKTTLSKPTTSKASTKNQTKKITPLEKYYGSEQSSSTSAPSHVRAAFVDMSASNKTLPLLPDPLAGAPASTSSFEPNTFDRHAYKNSLATFHYHGEPQQFAHPVGSNRSQQQQSSFPNPPSQVTRNSQPVVHRGNAPRQSDFEAEMLRVFPGGVPQAPLLVAEPPSHHGPILAYANSVNAQAAKPLQPVRPSTIQSHQQPPASSQARFEDIFFL